MFTTSQLIQKFPSSPLENSDGFSIYSVMEVMSYVNLETGIDKKRTTTDYYYRIPILELAKSEIPDETIENMIKGGWFVTKDRKYVKKLV